jgi:hypothetical protein
VGNLTTAKPANERVPVESEDVGKENERGKANDRASRAISWSQTMEQYKDKDNSEDEYVEEHSAEDQPARSRVRRISPIWIP